MQYNEQALEKKTKKWWDVLWALIFLFIVLDRIFYTKPQTFFYNNQHTWEGLVIFRRISFAVIVGLYFMLEIVTHYHKRKIKKMPVAERGFIKNGNEMRWIFIRVVKEPVKNYIFDISRQNVVNPGSR